MCLLHWLIHGRSSWIKLQPQFASIAWAQLTIINMCFCATSASVVCGVKNLHCAGTSKKFYFGAMNVDALSIQCSGLLCQTGIYSCPLWDMLVRNIALLLWPINWRALTLNGLPGLWLYTKQCEVHYGNPHVIYIWPLPHWGWSEPYEICTNVK